MADFLLDQNLPRGAVKVFQELGFSATHVSSVKLDDASDKAIWRYAAANNLVIVTKDMDFAEIHDPMLRGPVNVVRLLVGNTTNRSLYPWLRENWHLAQMQLDSGQSFVELG
jgi:predicted nuclease of predicted toxin-antitoxin system